MRLTLPGLRLQTVCCGPQAGWRERLAIHGLSTTGAYSASLDCGSDPEFVNADHFVLGATGVGKRFLGCVLANADCRQGFRALYVRMPRLVHQLSVARADGTYASELGRLSRFDVLVLDDFQIAPMKDTSSAISSRSWRIATTTPRPSSRPRCRRKLGTRCCPIRPSRTRSAIASSTTLTSSRCADRACGRRKGSHRTTSRTRPPPPDHLQSRPPAA
jgi:hypothetical protein